MGKLAGLMKLSRYYASFVDYDFARVYFGTPSRESSGNGGHIQAAIQWLCRAQDANTEDDGVSRSYSLIYHQYFKKKGWVASYPETTGYIIPTMLDYAAISDSHEYFERALRMADWECDVQLDNGAVQGGTVDQKPTPAVFNTGQVIFGWLRAYKETLNEKYLDSAKRAGAFLLSIQADDGSWRKNLSDFAGGSKMDFFSYNTRTAWALLALSEVYDPGGNFRSAGIRNIDFALQQQLGNGWFCSNCLTNPDQPLTHTIAYCIRGILESGIILENGAYINQARKAADALVTVQRDDGSLAGRYNKDWQGTVDWSCLTGNAQTSIIWGKLYQLTGEEKYLRCMKHINTYLKKVQLLGVSKPDLYGGVSGSYPLKGQYGQFEILNWAVKFFIDALLLEEKLNNSRKFHDYLGPNS